MYDMMLEARPNPFNPQTTITYYIADPGPVTLQIYDIQGRLVKILERTYRESGTYAVDWLGQDNNGSPVSSGVYFIRLESGGHARLWKIVLLK